MIVFEKKGVAVQTPELLDNIMKRVKERATIVNYFLRDGWLYIRCATNPSAKRARKALGGGHDGHICGGKYSLEVLLSHSRCHMCRCHQ